MNKIENIIIEKIGPYGAMISGSKSGYIRSNPNNLAVFNSNLIMDIDGNLTKIWWGDLDLTKSKDSLIEISKECGKSIYILREMDARFGNEQSPLIGRYVFLCHPDGAYELGKYESAYFDNNLEKNHNAS